MAYFSAMIVSYLFFAVVAQPSNNSHRMSDDLLYLLQSEPAKLTKTFRKSSVLQVDTSLATTFQGFIQTYGRTYEHDSAEYQRRIRIFAKELAAVEAQNAKPGRLWTAGINQFSDRTQKEVKSFRGWRPRPLGDTLPLSMGLLQHELNDHGNAAALPEEYSWSHLWATSNERVRMQTCDGQCWAAASSQLLEAHAEIHQGMKRTFSMGEITQCTPDPFKCGGDGGCKGATVELALSYVMLNGLGEDENSTKCPTNIISPNQSKESGLHEALPGIRNAPASAPSKAFGMIGWRRLPENKYEPLMRALVETGPVAVAVRNDWKMYKSGIFNSCGKGGEIDHAMLLIGYGADASKGNAKYWHLQNSWGKEWGEHGRIRLLRTDDEENYCGEDHDPRMGTACDDGARSAESVRICGMCGILYDTVVPVFQSSGAPLSGRFIVVLLSLLSLASHT